MTKILFFLSIIICTSNNYGSQRNVKQPSYRDITIRNNPYYEKKYPKPRESKILAVQDNENPFLPRELHPLIIHYATNDISTRTIKEATKTFKALLLTNTEFKKILDNKLFTNNFIKDLAYKYHWSHESIARSLRTLQSKRILKIQQELRTLCCTPEENDSLLSEKLNKLITQGVNLEFIYNHKSEQKTGLMISMEYDNNVFNLLLEYGANINGTTSLGMSPLHVAVSDPINEDYCMQLITHPAVAINQKNMYGATPLLHALTHTQRTPTNRPLVKIVKAMLKAGADPECGNKFNDKDKRHNTPLKVAQKLNNRPLINTIQRAIKAKQTAKS